MTDTPTTNYGLRQQELGTNTNTWGDTKLNQVLQDIDQIFGTIKPIAITGDYTITSTNYVTTADNKNAGFKFTGALTANANITLPTVNAKFLIIDATTGGFSLVIKTSAGASVTMGPGSIAQINTNGVDAVNVAVNYIGARLQGVTAGTLSTDAVNKVQMETAIATAGIPASAGTVLVSSSDTTANYLANKIVGSGAAAVSTLNSGGNEQVQISVGALGLTDGGLKSSGFTAVSNSRYNCVFGASGTITLPAAPAAKDVICLHLAGNYVYTLNPGSLKINSIAASLPMLGNQTIIIEYSGATDGWV